MNLHDYYDGMADISASTREAIDCVETASIRVEQALSAMTSLSRAGLNDMKIAFNANSTTNDIHRNLLFLQLLLSQTKGLLQCTAFKELLELTNYQFSEDEF